jgi:hypothetical protein
MFRTTIFALYLLKIYTFDPSLEQSIPEKPASHSHNEVSWWQIPLPKQLFGQFNPLGKEQSSPRHSFLHLHFPVIILHYPLEVNPDLVQSLGHLFKINSQAGPVFILIIEIPMKPVLQMHFPYSHLPLLTQPSAQF